MPTCRASSASPWGSTAVTEIDRRSLLGLALGALLAPGAGRAASADGAFVGARFDAAGASVAVFAEGGGETASRGLPTRGHGVAVSPDGAHVVVVARRPGRWALALAIDGLRPVAELVPPAGRHFYGHGCFSADGTRFFTTENDFDGGDGVLGVWDATRGFARVGERRSGGVGPHDVAPMPDGRHLIVANGGIRTHPDSGRDMLDRAEMRSNLALLSLERDAVVAVADLGADLRLSSIRHLAVAEDGDVVFGCQYEGGDAAAPLLVGDWRPLAGGTPRLWEMPDPALARMADYVGSVALGRGDRIAAATSPRGGNTAFFDRGSGRFLGLSPLADVCGIAPSDAGFVVTSGGAGVRSVGLAGGGIVEAPLSGIVAAPLGGGLAAHAWDNHLSRLGAPR